jgi:parallel beta-helix repeat protein
MKSRFSYPVRVRAFLGFLLIAQSIILLLGIAGSRVAQAQTTIAVRYNAQNRTIYVGGDYTNPAEKRDPANAPKTSITIPQIATALTIPALLVDQGNGIWLLRANIVVSGTARLEATNATISQLRLDSTPGANAINAVITASGGHLLFQDVNVSSWNTIANDVDITVSDKRSYLLAQNGGRMDIVRSNVGYLGWASGEPSGLSWRKRGDPNDPVTGATGSIIDSTIHHHYFGQYSYEAYGLVIRGSRFHSNLYYGIDPHDFSQNFVVENNIVHNNGKHGIIFSRGCTNNIIRNNEVYGNHDHGIMLDRGTNNNLIENNTVYDNFDGIAIFQSSNNTIYNNILRNNQRGIRINATYDSNDDFDGISTANIVTNNRIENNTQYGIYLYERADRNLLAENTLIGNVDIAIYIKTFGNTLRGNTIRNNGRGIEIIGGELTPFPPNGPTPVAALGKPGAENGVFANLIEANNGNGIRIANGDANTIGAATEISATTDGNMIRNNGSYGLAITGGSSDTILRFNTVENNAREGVFLKQADSLRNRITRNIISGNSGAGIVLSSGANAGLTAPTIDGVTAGIVTGSAAANITIEVYRDPNRQGSIWLGTTSADSNGRWSLSLPPVNPPSISEITALSIDAQGNTSAFGGYGALAVEPSFHIGAGPNGELMASVTGVGAFVTLPQIRDGLQTISPTVTLIEHQGNGVWQSNISLFIGRGVTLTLDSPDIVWLKLRSQASDIRPVGNTTPYNYRSFTTLRTHNGAILVNGTKITSWDPIQNDYDRSISNGRAFVLAKYQARMDIQDAELSYLGFSDGESYGVSWRDVNEAVTPDLLQTRVTGNVIDSIFSHNYYGIYTYQAANMTFRGNSFHNNLGYGFDPHDFSHHFLVEDNDAYENGNHGFIISRGCNNFVFRNNRSYNNQYSQTKEDRNAHGFMLDPGSPNSASPQAGSYNNVLENNQAWGNDGYGIRILGSNDNTIRNNQFWGNLQGVSLEQTSTGNIVEANVIYDNALYGIYLIGAANGNTIRFNTVTDNGRHGIYLKTSNTIVEQNTVLDNGTSDSVTPDGSGIAFLPETATQGVADFVSPIRGVGLLTKDPDLLNPPMLSAVPSGNQVHNNLILRSAAHGIEIKGSNNIIVGTNIVQANGIHGIYLTNATTGTQVRNNILSGNFGQGIRANGTDTKHNRWHANSVFGNALGGIVTTSGANDAVIPPSIQSKKLTSQTCEVRGQAMPNATVEIYSDWFGQGQFFEGQTTTDATGNFVFFVERPCIGSKVNALVTDTLGNSSSFSNNIGGLLKQIVLPLIAP